MPTAGYKVLHGKPRIYFRPMLSNTHRQHHWATAVRSSERGDPRRLTIPPTSRFRPDLSSTRLDPDMNVATAHSSAFTSPGVGAGSSASSNDQGAGSSANDDHRSDQPGQRGVGLGMTPVHVVIDIPAYSEIDFGIGDVDGALLARRPTQNPGTQVVQLTITSSCLPGSTHDVSGG